MPVHYMASITSNIKDQAELKHQKAATQHLCLKAVHLSKAYSGATSHPLLCFKICKHVILSNCHPVILSSYHFVILSSCPFVTHNRHLQLPCFV